MVGYCKILIVDDEFLMRQGLKHMLDWEAEGFQIIGEASNGQEALVMLEQLHPNIILSDMVMPLMDGLEFTMVVKEKYPDIQVIIISSFDDFEYVRRVMKHGATDYILKSNLNPKDLLFELQKIAKNIPGLVLKQDTAKQNEKTIERFLLGYEQDISMQDCHAIFPESCYVIYGVNIKRYNANGQDMSGALYDKLEAWLEQCTCAGGMLFYLEEATACMVLNFPKKNECILEEELQKLSEQMRILYEYLLFVKSVTLSSLKDVRQFYQNNMAEYLEQIFYYKQNPFLELPLEQPEKVETPKMDYNQFHTKVTQKRYEEAMRLFFDYIRQAVSAQLDEERLKNQAKNMLFNFLDMMHGNPKDMEEMRRNYFRRIDAAFYAEDFLDNMEQIECELVDYVRENGNSEDATIGRIMDYIDTHYMEELDLKELAGVFNFSYSYLSTYFNQRISEGFSGYLNKTRIEQAKILLKTTDLSIAQVSSQVGYADQSYFCRVFKKITGGSPSAWKRQQLDKA